MPLFLHHKNNDGGAILNMVSVAAATQAERFAYSMSKGAILP
jgi:NAD(P)-dependent dehydrogenase (short-subunit alcohol dehydrogenase family)